MGCFLACFCDSKRRKQSRKSSVEIPPSNHGFKASEVVQVSSIDLNKDSLVKLEDQIELCHATENTSEQIIEDDKVVSCKEVKNNLDVIKKGKSGMEEDESRGSSNLSNAFSLPLNHRYADFPNSDDEYVKEMNHLDDEEEVEEERKDDTNDDDGVGKSKLLIEKETSDSLFSLSFGSRKHVSKVEAGENEVSSPNLSHQPDKASSDKEPRCPNENVESVLNPIENVNLCLSILDLNHQPDKTSSNKESRCPNENVEFVNLCTVETGENEVYSHDLSHQLDKTSSDKESRCPNENVEPVLNPIENVNLCLSIPDLSHQPNKTSSDKESRCPNENVESVLNPNENVESVLNSNENVTLCLSRPDLSYQHDKASSDKEPRCPNENVEYVLNPIENVTLCLSSSDLSHQPDKTSSDKESRCPNENVESVLNPIENVTLCLSAAKVKTLAPVQHLRKENISLDKGCDVHISPEPTFQSMRKLKENRSDFKHVKDEIAVDTSLSNWLVESESTPKSKSSTSSIGNSPMWTRNSAKSYEDRPILGALTLEELRQFSAFSTPRRLRSRSPEEMPIIGTVGSYWSHTGQDTDSNPGSSCRGSTKTARKNTLDERVHWNSTPFLERLDMALTSNSAEV